MEHESLSATPMLLQSEHDKVRALLRARYRVHGEYVSAPTVARILGLGRTTVHEQSKAGRFVIPHRLANRKPLFLLDDLVDWMVGAKKDNAAAASPAAAPAPVKAGARPVFRYPKAEAAYLLECEKRGIRAPR